MKFKKAKCRVLHMGQGNPNHGYRLANHGIESSLAKKDLDILGDEKLSLTHIANPTYRCLIAAQKANRILCCIKRSVANRSRYVILPLYFFVLHM